MDTQTRTPRLVNTKGATEIIPVSESQLNKLRCYGGGPAFIRVGRSIFYEVSSLEDWIDANRHSTTSDYQK
jgi:hypothetical protein